MRGAPESWQPCGRGATGTDPLMDYLSPCFVFAPFNSDLCTLEQKNVLLLECGTGCVCTQKERKGRIHSYSLGSPPLLHSLSWCVSFSVFKWMHSKNVQLSCALGIMMRVYVPALHAILSALLCFFCRALICKWSWKLHLTLISPDILFFSLPGQSPSLLALVPLFLFLQVPLSQNYVNSTAAPVQKWHFAKVGQSLTKVT